MLLFPSASPLCPYHLPRWSFWDFTWTPGTLLVSPILKETHNHAWRGLHGAHDMVTKSSSAKYASNWKWRGSFVVVSSRVSLFKLWKLCSVGCATSSSLGKNAPEEEEYVPQQQKRPVWWERCTKVSGVVRRKRWGRGSRMCGPRGWTRELPVTTDSLTSKVARNITPVIHYNEGEVEVAAEADVKLKATGRSLKRWGGGRRMQERKDVILTLRRAAIW